MVNLMEESNEILNENGCEMLEEKALDTHFSDRPVDLVENIPKSWTRFDYDKFHLEKIASGFFGTVYKVRDRDTNQIMVMKCNNLTVEDGLLNEIQLMSQLCHPNILRFLGVCYDKNNIHLLTEYINGGTLEQLLLEDHSIELWWTVRLKLSHDIAQGMEYLHSQGVIHRDLASKNCLIRKGEHGDLTSVVADFGLSAHLPKNHSEEKLTVVGSPYGMAPEMLRGETYNELADVFSYGILLCEIIGRVPANPDELPRTSTFGLDIDKFQEMVGDCPAEFLAIAVVCCQINAQDRPSFISIVKLLDVLQDNYGSDSLSPREIETYDYLHSFYCRHKLLTAVPRIQRIQSHANYATCQ